MQPGAKKEWSGRVGHEVGGEGVVHSFKGQAFKGDQPNSEASCGSCWRICPP